MSFLSLVLLPWLFLVFALVRPVVVSRNSGFSKILGGFSTMSKMSSSPRFLSTKVSGSLDACLSVSSFCCCLSTCRSTGCSPPTCGGVARLVLDLRCRSCVAHAPAILVVYSFLVLFIRDVTSHVFFHLWMDWPVIFVHDDWESQFWECEPEPWRFLGCY